MQSNDLRGIIVGSGFMGRTHLEAYLKIPGVRIAAIVDRDAERAGALASLCQARTYGTLAEALEAERPSFADVCLPSRLHRDAVVAALESGADVLVEKPLAVGIEDARAMAEAELRAGRRAMVAHVCRFLPEYIFAKELIESGRLGKPLYYWAARESVKPLWSWGGWINDRAQSGGTLLDLSIHDIDVANWLLGKPVDFRAAEVVKEKDGPAHTVSSLAYEGGARASIEACHLMPQGYPFTTSYRLLLENGFAEWRSRGEAASLSVFTDDGEERIDLDALEPPVGCNGYLEELRHFVTCLREGRPFRIGLSEASLSVETVLKLRASMA
jgi:predicted dehydrogenase